METTFYYSGLPSGPRLVARTGATIWEAPTGPEAYRRLQHFRAVGTHSIVDLWEDNIVVKIYTILDEMKVAWTSIDVVRIGYVDETHAPVILWIGVNPDSLSQMDGILVARRCKQVLEDHNIDDIETEIRESVVTQLAGAKMLEPISVYYNDPVDIRHPFSTSLGFPISTQSTPWIQGSVGFFGAYRSDPQKHLFVTARHAVLSPNRNNNEHFPMQPNGNQTPHNITLLGDVGYKKYLASIADQIRRNGYTLEYEKRRLEAYAKPTDKDTSRGRRDAEAQIERVDECNATLGAFQGDLSANWATLEDRIIGRVVLSPPLAVNTQFGGYMEDWAAIEVDADKINAGNLQGNVISVVDEIRPYDMMMMMNAEQKKNLFEYPFESLLKVSGTIPDEEFYHPTALDKDGNPCLMVLKRGYGSGLTIGRANNVYSYVRNHYEDGNIEISKEWAILPFDSKFTTFSKEGDSGALVVDGLGRMGGLITSGAGNTGTIDITYATPIKFILQCMKHQGLDVEVI